MKLSFALRLILGLAFIVSGALKLVPITYFELLLEYQGLASLEFAPYLARAVIIIELFVGCAVLFGFGRGNWLALFYLSLLLLFSFQLILQISQDGNVNSCGCFGTWFSISPAESLIKNLGLAVILFFAVRKNKEQKSGEIYNLLILVTVTIAIFISFPVGTNLTKDDNGTMVRDLEIEPLSDLFVNADLSSGRVIITALSTECSHCFEQGLELNLLSKKLDDFPVVYNVLVGPNPEEFLMSIQASGQTFVSVDSDELYDLIKSGTPNFWLLSEGEVIGSWSRTTFDRSSILKTLEE